MPLKLLSGSRDVNTWKTVCPAAKKDLDFFSKAIEPLSLKLRPEVTQLGNGAGHSFNPSDCGDC